MCKEENLAHSSFQLVLIWIGSYWTECISISLCKLLKALWTVKTLESPLDSKEIKPVDYKGNQHWIFIGRTDAEALAHWAPDAQSQFIGKEGYWERLRAGGEAGNRGWDGWMASLT